MPKQPGLWYRFARGVVRWVFFAPFGGVRASGVENIPREGPVLLAPNHVSFVDPPAVGLATPYFVAYMAKEELFRVPIFGPILHSVGAFPVKRGQSDSAAVRVALEILAQGHALLVFPEGSRGDGERLLPIQTGIAMLAKRSGAQIVPVGVGDTLRLLPRGAKFFHRARVRVHFGEAFKYEDIPCGRTERERRELFVQELARRIREACARAGLMLEPP